MEEKRSVSTDALATLGTIIQDGGRDAIHLAVEPIEAAEDLLPGQHIGIVDGKATTKTPNKLGIVDPFVGGTIPEGKMFWLVVYPRQITSLRHVWSHPDFKDSESTKAKVIDVESNVEAAQRWISAFAEQLGFSYTRLMEYADSWAWGEDDYTYDNTETYKEYWDKFPEFWEKYEVIRGPLKAGVTKDCFFTCSC